ncbi:MAG: hypothetical protein JWN75_1188 [Candidatus Saccharibacteria bacterium]|nr:hypothetical protein [Candidatus Saccharibacteria bacterium]
MPTFLAQDANGNPVAIEKPLIPGRASASTSRPVVLSSEDLAQLDALETELVAIKTQIGSLSEATPTADTDAAGLNGRLKQVAARLTTLMTRFPSTLGTGGGLKVDVNNAFALETGGNLATSATALTAILAKLTADPATQTTLSAANTNLASILTAIQAQRAETLWIDDTNNYFIRINRGGTITWTLLDGTASSPPGTGARPADTSAYTISRTAFQATASATGYTSGDFLDHFVLLDPDTGVVASNFWVNLSTGIKLASAPAGGNVVPFDAELGVYGTRTDAANVATDATSISAMSVWKQVSKSLQTIAATLSGTLTVAAHAVTQSGSWVLSAGTALIGKVDHSTTGIGQGKKSVTTAGTDVVLAASTAAKWVTVQAYRSNTGYIAVGAAGVDAVAAGDGVQLAAGESVTIPVTNLSAVFIDATVNNEGVRYTYGT